MSVDKDFAAERRNVVQQIAAPYWCAACGVVHPSLHVPPGYGAYCGYCNQRFGECRCGTTPARDAPTESTPAPTIEKNEWDVCPVCRLATLYCRGH